MDTRIKSRLKRTLVLSVIAIIIGVGVGFVQIKMENASVVTRDGNDVSEAQPVAGLKLGGPFTLSDQDGEKVTEATYEGQYKLIYFGFTFCPAVCPTELQKMRAALDALPSEIAERIQPIFVTIDPERDTVAVMKEYVTLFHPRLVGLTGTVPQIEMMKKNYRVFAAKAGDIDSPDYTMDHSSFIYLMGPKDELVAMYRTNDSADFMADDIKNRLKTADAAL